MGDRTDSADNEFPDHHQAFDRRHHSIWSNGTAYEVRASPILVSSTAIGTQSTGVLQHRIQRKR